MSLKIYLYSMSLGTLLCWVAWFFVITNLAPEEAGFVGLLFFYISLFLALVGTASVIGFLILRARTNNDDVVFRHVRQTFRHSVLISTFAIASLMLKAQGWLSAWALIGLLVFFFVLESILTNRTSRNAEYV